MGYHKIQHVELSMIGDIFMMDYLDLRRTKMCGPKKITAAFSLVDGKWTYVVHMMTQTWWVVRSHIAHHITLRRQCNNNWDIRNAST